MGVISIADVLLAYLVTIGPMAFSYDKRIRGGIEVSITEFPYFGYIVSGLENPKTREIDPTPLCGAALISDSYILSHSSCVEHYSQRKLFVQFGMKSWCPPIDYVDDLHYWADLQSVYFQRDYNGIAIALLSNRIPITPIAAPQTTRPFRNALFGLPGLGKTGPNSLQSCKPNVAQLVPVGPDQRLCPVTGGVLCFKPNYNNSLHGSMCHRDEGGPVIERIEGRDYLREPLQLYPNPGAVIRSRPGKHSSLQQ